jgi:hypothetical protein
VVTVSLSTRRLLVAVLCALALGATSGCDVITGLLGGGGENLGEPFEAGPFEATVTQVRVVPKIEGFYPEIDTPGDGWALAVIDVALRNTSGAEAEPPTQLQAGLITSADPDIQQALVLTSNGPYDYRDLLGVGPVPAGETVTGTMIVPVRTDSVLRELVFRGWVDSSEDIIVDLGDMPATPADVAAPAAVGTPIDVNGLKITVTDVQYPAEYTYKSGIMSGSYAPEGDGQYVELNLTIENVSNPEAHDVSQANVTGTFGGGGPGSSARVYADGVACYPENLIGLFKSEAYPSPYWTQADMAPLATGQSASAYLVFIVPSGAQELLFEYRQPVLGPEPQVKLK